MMVFVGGLHRSGTTLLASVLGSHPQLSGFEQTGAPENEGQHLQTVLPTDEQYGGPGRFAFAAAAHLTEASPYAAPEPARRLGAQWSRYWDLSCPVLLEKSPPNLVRFRYLQRVFPGSRFILAIRHPVPVTLSTRKWSPALTHRQLIEHWLHAHEIAFADARFLRHFTVVRYEDLMSDPAATMSQVAAFIGVPPRFRLAGVDQVRGGRYFPQWAQETEPEARAETVRDLEGAVRRYGYSLEVTDGPDTRDPRDRRAVAG